MEDSYLDTLHEDLTDMDHMDPCNQPGGDSAAWEEEQVFQDGLAEGDHEDEADYFAEWAE